ncbi:MAG: hypothetical protein GTN89_10285 [Acidobacteria bacterium]|nr:hypothetical protein [Acidobacteriota bacterium]NIO59640.1 hypothetical protein [Acidobacteriota bacterium]NIQ30739.1 hypothetical protein [Acidobacteriota bacterium]
MAARNAARVLDLTGFHQYEMDPAVMTLVSVYQYFIGNTDWSLSALHNITLLSDADSRFLPVPYDFDWSGVVDARYAAPHPRLGTRSVRDRVFISGCLTEAELEPVMELFRARRDTVYALYRQQAGLEAKTVERTLEYFDDFFETIDDPKSFKREFVRGCPADE